jgi:hypothetical protein
MTKFDYEVECPHCGAAFQVARIRAGRQETCPVCRGAVDVVEAGAAGAQPEPAPAPVRVAGGQGLAPAPEQGAAQEAVAPEVVPADARGPAMVCCAREEKLNPIKIGPLVAAFSGLGNADARRKVVKSMGLLMDGMAMDTARGMVAALEEEGVEAFVVPATWVPDPEELSFVRVYGADEGALRIQTDDEGSVKSVRWQAVVAGLCVRAAFGPLKTELRAVDTYAPVIGAGIGVAAIPQRSFRMERRQEEAKVRAVLMLRHGARGAYALAFTEEQVRYSYLGERMKPNRAQNLALFLSDVLNWAGHAFFPAGFRAAAEGRRAHITKVLGKVDYDNYVRWTLCCAAARGLFGTS